MQFTKHGLAAVVMQPARALNDSILNGLACAGYWRTGGCYRGAALRQASQRPQQGFILGVRQNREKVALSLFLSNNLPAVQLADWS
jgi:hypothetical protein